MRANGQSNLAFDMGTTWVKETIRPYLKTDASNEWARKVAAKVKEAAIDRAMAPEEAKKVVSLCEVLERQGWFAKYLTRPGHEMREILFKNRKKEWHFHQIQNHTPETRTAFPEKAVRLELNATIKDEEEFLHGVIIMPPSSKRLVEAGLVKLVQFDAAVCGGVHGGIQLGGWFPDVNHNEHCLVFGWFSDNESNRTWVQSSRICGTCMLRKTSKRGWK